MVTAHCQASVRHCTSRLETKHATNLPYPMCVGAAALEACRASMVKGTVWRLLSLVVYSRKGPPGPAPLTATDVQPP